MNPLGYGVTPGWAIFSEDGIYRYVLGRQWGDGPLLAWIMLNPSTATASELDPTVRRCKSFTEREGYDGFIVLNVFALRSTDPKALDKHPDPAGPHNLDTHLTAYADSRVTGFVCAWGANKNVPSRFLSTTVNNAAPKPVYVLGWTKARQPRHPLYVKGDTPFVLLDAPHVPV